MASTHHIKVSILDNLNVEKFYIKQQFNNGVNLSAFETFKKSVITRNPLVNQADIKIYWIDSENDKILVCCEEDYLVFIEEMKVNKLKIFIKLPTKTAVDEKKKSKKLTKKSESKSKRGEKICKILSSIDPANLCDSTSCKCCTETKNLIQASSLSDYHVSPETIKILSSTITECMKPCYYINTILNEIQTMFSQIDASAQTSSSTTSFDVPKAQPAAPEVQKTSEIVANEPEVPQILLLKENHLHDKTPEIPEEKSKIEVISIETIPSPSMDNGASADIINNNSSVDLITLESQMESIAPISSNSADISVKNPEEVVEECDGKIEGQLLKSKSMESLSSVEICGSSNVDEDSREWTILDAMNDEDDEIDRNSLKSDDEPFYEVENDVNEGKKAEEEEKGKAEKSITEQEEIIPEKVQSLSVVDVSSVSSSLMVNSDHLKTSVEEKIVDDSSASSTNSVLEIPPKSIETPAQSSIEDVIAKLKENQARRFYSDESKPSSILVDVSIPSPAISIESSPDVVPPTSDLIPPQEASNVQNQAAAPISTMTFEDLTGPRNSSNSNLKYHPNRKINRAVHAMVQMGFSNNEGDWLTQLMINLDGDVAEAINFLAPKGN